MSQTTMPPAGDDQLDPPRTGEPEPFWSPWATVGWGLLIAVVFVAVQLGITVAWIAPRLGAEPGLDAASALDPGSIGGLFAVSTIACAAICSALIWVAVLLRRGADPRRALALGPPRPTALAGWLLATVVLIVISDLVSVGLGRQIVPDFMTEIFASTSATVLLWTAVVVAAPCFEELFVRGFLLEGLRRGRLGPAGAVVVVSMFWAGVHLQYEVYEIATIFLFGLVLGAARLAGRSLWLPIAMHVLVNLVATIETMIVLRMSSGSPG